MERIGLPFSTSIAVTNGVRVETRSFYVPEKSDPRHGQYLFGYRIRITNLSDTTVQLVERHWVIVDGLGRVEEVRGPGVVGELPVLEPGGGFEYTSACPLPTPWGTMEGEYVMRPEGGGQFLARIEPFSLVCPNLLN